MYALRLGVGRLAVRLFGPKNAPTTMLWSVIGLALWTVAIVVVCRVKDAPANIVLKGCAVRLTLNGKTIEARVFLCIVAIRLTAKTIGAFAQTVLMAEVVLLAVMAREVMEVYWPREALATRLAVKARGERVALVALRMMADTASVIVSVAPTW